jgi:transposase
MNDAKYIGLDVHQATISAVVLDSTGKVVMESILETKAATILQFVHGLRGSLHVTFEEGTCAHWLHDLLKPHVSRVVVCDPRKNALLKAGNKNDRIDARKLADLLRTGLLSPVYHGENGIRTLKELARSYLAVTQDLTRVMNRLKALYRSWAIPCAGERVYAARHRQQWLIKISERVYAAGPSSTTSNLTLCDHCIARCGTICWQKAKSIVRRSCCVRFLRLVRFEQRY